MKTLWCQLGRNGDIMTLLPILWKEAQSGEKPGLMVAAEYAPLLEGVKYVEPVTYDGPHHDIEGAVAKAKTLCSNVVVTQINGPREAVREKTYKPAGETGARATSFQKEMWRLAGKLPLWDELWPLVFDKRNDQREDALLRKNNLVRKGKQKPLILLALKSNSSPFPYADELREAVTKRYGNTHRILELPEAERIYDLLAIYEKASLLIAVDSAPLHLAWACRKLPVFALTQDKPSLWHGAAWRPNHVWYCRYGDWPARKETILDALKFVPFLKNTEQTHAPGPTNRLLVGSNYSGKCKWDDPSPWTLVVPVGACGRDSSSVFSDEKTRNPFLRDVIRMGIQRATEADQEIILMRPQCSQNQIKLPHARGFPSFAYRLMQTETGLQFMPIVDMFCATRKWWKEVLPEIPDYVLSNDHYWSNGLWALFKSKGAADVTGACTFVKEAA